MKEKNGCVKMKNDAFISYRRDNGFYLACLIHEQLKKRGVSSFLDLVEKRHSGKIDEEVFDAIENSCNFVLVLSKGALDDCINEEDWVRKEIFAAIKKGCNIIPILDDEFEWPRSLYAKMSEEIKSIEKYSRVKSSKDYLDAMIDRVISLMQWDENLNLTHGNVKMNTEVISTERYFFMELKKNIDAVDMAFHAGSEWFTDVAKNDLLYGLVEQGIHLRILLNNPKISEKMAKHMRHSRKIYIGFENCIRKWIDLKKEYPDKVEIKMTDIPILRRYYSIHMKDSCMDSVNVKYYTYDNPDPKINYQQIFYSDSEYFGLYRKEFEYLWNHPLDNMDGQREEVENEYVSDAVKI